jgi:hypothetical protein
MKVEFRTWHYAYPIYAPPQTPERWHPIQVSDGIYYINAFESIISTIETELISSKNVALLLAKKHGIL